MEADVTLELYVRSLAPRGDGGRLDELLADLSELASRDRVGGYEVTVWGDAVRTDGPAAVTRPGAETLATVELFEAWTDRRGADFPVEAATRGTVADERRPVVELPPAALAEYRDGDLVRVTPHVADGAVATVEDHLGALAADGPTGPDVAAEPLAPDAVAAADDDEREAPEGEPEAAEREPDAGRPRGRPAR